MATTQSLSADWALESGVWTLDTALPGESATARSTGIAGLEVLDGERAEITPNGSWTFELSETFGIAAEGVADLTLDGDLTITTDFETAQPFAAAVIFDANGILSGGGDISIERPANSSAGVFALAGVTAGGLLDLSAYDGDVSVINDNSFESELPMDSAPVQLPILGEFDAAQSAIALGVGSIDLDGEMELGTIDGSINQTIEAAALSRAVEDFTEDDFADAVNVALGVGVAGAVNGGIVDGASISGGANSASSYAETTGFGEASAANVALGVGVIGEVDFIDGSESRVDIYGTASGGDALAYGTFDGETFADSLALGAGLLGSSGSIIGADFGAFAESGEATSEAVGFASANSIALSVGFGGLAESVTDASFDATARSNLSYAFSDEFESVASSLAVSSALLGTFSEITGVTLNAFSLSDSAEAESAGPATALAASVSSGVLAQVESVQSTTVTSAATSGNAFADSFFVADADASATAFGLASPVALIELIESLPEAILGNFDGLLGEFDFGPGPAADAIEFDDSAPRFLDADITVAASAGDTEAYALQGDLLLDGIEGEVFPEFGFGSAYASSSSLAIAVDRPGDADLTGSFDVSALGGSAFAESSNGPAFADTFAEAIGVTIEQDVFVGELSADMDLVAVAGDAEADFLGFDGFFIDEIEAEGFPEDAPRAEADAAAFATAYFDVGLVEGSVSGTVDQSAIGGEAVALVLGGGGLVIPQDPSIEGFEGEGEFEFSEAFASAYASSVFLDADELNGDLDVELTSVANGGEALARNQFGELANADAAANAIAAYASIFGDVAGDFSLVASGGTALADIFAPQFLIGDSIEGEALLSPFGAYADASARSIAIFDDVEGTVSADMDLTAVAGDARARSSIFDSREAFAFARAAGIDGELIGDFTGEMAISAIGGTAVIEGFDSFGFVGFEEFGMGGYADASGNAKGIGFGGVALDGTLSGNISVLADGGTAVSLERFGGLEGPLQPPLQLDGIEGDHFESAPSLIRDARLNASARAVAIDGDVSSASISSELTAVAIGGSAIDTGFLTPADAIESEEFPMQDFGRASAFAAGIAGQTVTVDSFTGDIVATATAGTLGLIEGQGEVVLPNDSIEGDEGPGFVELPEIPEPEVTMPDAAFAAGIMSYSAPEAIDSTATGLDVVIGGRVHAFAGSADESETSVPNVYAASIYGGMEDDAVELAEGADLIGDINLGGGLNTLSVTGNTIMEGNILSTGREFIDFMLSIQSGSGTVDFSIDSGLFTAVRTVKISDLAGALNIGAEGGIAPVLSQDPFDGSTSLLDVNFGENGSSADVNFAAGSTVLPVFAEGVDLTAVVGNRYLIVDAEGLITDEGALVDNSQSPFEFSLEVADILDTDGIEGLDLEGMGQHYLLTVDSVSEQDGDETPGTVQTNQAVNAASQAVMIDISKHSANLRSLLRRTVVSGQGSAPTGAAGPEARSLENGDWLSYISVFGNIGRQDTENGLAGFDYETYGFVAGQEKLFGEQLILGIAGSYAKTDIDGLSNSGGGDSDLYSGTVYANWFTERWYAEGGLSYGYSENDVRRVDFKNDVYTGDYDSNLFGSWFELGYTTEHGQFGIEPYARVTYIHGDHDGFTESGPDALIVTTQDNDTDNFKTELGVRANRSWMQDDGSSYLLEVKAAWEHEWADQGVSVKASYMGDPNLTLRSAEADEDALILGVRTQWRNGRGFAIGFEYEPTISGNWYNHNFNGTLQYNW